MHAVKSSDCLTVALRLMRYLRAASFLFITDLRFFLLSLNFSQITSISMSLLPHYEMTPTNPWQNHRNIPTTCHPTKASINPALAHFR